MTLQKAKSIARHLGLTLRQLRSGNYRVNFRDGNETTAYYTDKLEDAVNAVVAMARKRAFSSDYRADGTGGDRARRVMTEDMPRSGHDETNVRCKATTPARGPKRLISGEAIPAARRNCVHRQRQDLYESALPVFSL